MNSFFEDICNKRNELIASIDRIHIVPAIRNHLVQLFQKAHAVEPGLTGMDCGMGSVTVNGTYSPAGYPDSEFEDERNPDPFEAWKWTERSVWQPKHPETLEWLGAVNEFANNFSELPDIGRITVKDL